MRLKKTHFLNTLLEESNIPTSYKTLNYRFNDKLFYTTEGVKNFKQNNFPLITSYIAFPKFLKSTFNNSDIYSSKKIEQKHQDCFGIIINPDIDSISQYINSHFSKNSRSPILKKIKRLESCFNIKYQVFYGSIEKDYYDYLMNLTHTLLIRRFKQRNDTNFIIKNWEKYQSILFTLINKKKASLFVIFNNETPIQVSINFHYGKTFFAYIPAYNIDYSQFGLGNTAIYKQLEWCIENGYEYLDMGNGDLEYKKRWCNYHYNLETHIYYKKKSLIANVSARLEWNLIKIKNILKIVKNSKPIQKITTPKYNTRPFSPTHTLEKINNINIYRTTDLEEIDFKTNTKYEFIYKPLYDFLYAEKVHIDNIKLFKIKNMANSFILKGKTNVSRIDFKQ